jgi:hypothetical protein
MSPRASRSARAPIQLQVPANKTFKPDPRIPPIDAVRLIKYDFEKYGKAAERRRLIDRWTARSGIPAALKRCPSPWKPTCWTGPTCCCGGCT